MPVSHATLDRNYIVRSLKKVEDIRIGWVLNSFGGGRKFLQLHEHNRYDSVRDGIRERLSTRRSIADQKSGKREDIAVMEISLPEICLVLRNPAHPF